MGNEVYFELELEKVSADTAERVRKLIDSADFFNVPANLGMSSSTDEFLYKITVDTGDEYHSVRVTDTTMPKALSPLVRELTMQNVLNKEVSER